VERLFSIYFIDIDEFLDNLINIGNIEHKYGFIIHMFL